MLVAGKHETIKIQNDMKSHAIKYARLLLLLLTGMHLCFSLRGQEDSLFRYLSLAAGNNPALKAARLAWEASLQRLPQAGAYADPTLEAGAFPSPVEFAEGRQAAQFQLMQMFPWFGLRKAARTEAQHMANMASEQFREARDNVFMELYAQWYALCALRQQQVNNETNRQWMEQLEQLALRKYASAPGSLGSAYPATAGNTPAASPAPSAGGMNMGGGSAMPPAPAAQTDNGMTGGMESPARGMSEVLNVQLERLELESRAESLRAEIMAGKARFNALLNRPAESGIVLPDSLTRIPFRPDTETILREINGRNPMLGMLREEALAYKAKAEMERRMGYPMFGIGLQYMLMAPLQNMPAMNGMNGKDMIMPMLSVSIPLYRNKYKAAQKESRLLRQASEMKQADAFNRLEAELRQAIYLLDEAGRTIDLCHRQAGLAQAAANLAAQEFVSGQTGLGSVIQIRRQLLGYRLKEAEATASYNTMAAAIQKMIGFFTLK